MKIRISYARNKAQELLAESGIDNPSMPIKRLVKLIGAELISEPYDGDVSGMLLRRGGKTIIGVNKNHRLTRQRFTIAHEIGHFLLHDMESFHIDTTHPIRLRDKRRSQTVEDVSEIEANQFASELLMPSNFIAEDLPRYEGMDLEDVISKLAKRYKVSEQSMSIRLTSLEYIR